MASAADVERMLVEAIAHHEAGRFAQADAAYRAVLARDAVNVDALHFLGFLAFQRGEHAHAAELIARALALHPGNAHAQQNLGHAYLALGRAQEAAACFEQARALDPQLAAAHYNLGIAYRELGRRSDAAVAFREALRLDPGLAAAHYALGHLHCDEDRIAEAKACFAEAVRMRPDYAEARWSAAIAELPQVYALGEDPARARAAFAAGLAELERWCESVRPPHGADAVGAMQPFSLAYQEEANRPLLERYGKLCVRLMSEWRQGQQLPAAIPPRPKAAKLRIGIVSAQFHNHSVWHAIVKGWFRHLDRSGFALYAFHIGTGNDGETAFAASRAAGFEQGTRDLRAWVDAIGRAAPDVLIYPEIGMNPVALRLAAQRLAPVQAAAWGHPETTGLPTIDYYLSAEDFEPAGAQANYSERLVALPRLGCAFEPRAAEGAQTDLRQFGLQGEAPLLVCPGVPFKYAPQHDWVFPAIAERLGHCRLLFFGQSQRLAERLRAAFAARKLDAERFLVFLPWLSNSAFQSLVRQADVYLDTIGFSGFNTALLAVQNGLPVVTREGRFMRGRLASGILRRLGMPQLIAASEDEYVALVERLAQDRKERAETSRQLLARAGALFDDPAAIEGFERFLRDV